MGGSTKAIDTTPTDVRGLRKNLSSFLQGGNMTPNAPMQGPQGGYNVGPQQTFTAPGANTTPQGYNGMGMPPAPGGSGRPATAGLSMDQGGGSGLNMSGNLNSGNAMGSVGSNVNPLAMRSGYSGGGPPPPNRAMGMVGGDPPPPPFQGGFENGGGASPYPQAPTGTGGFNQMFNAGPQGGPVQLGPTAVMSAPGQINPQQINPNSIPQVGGAFNIPQVNSQQLNGADFNPMSQGFREVGTQFGAGGDPFSRGQIRDVGGGMASYGGTQSIDQLGGANSAFFQNMMNQMKPAFAQSRAESLAAAKEGLGNMGAGSALANSLGTATNRSLGDEQARLAGYAAQGVQMESNRQLQDAAMAAQVSMANANNDLRGQMANQGMDSQFLNTMLQQGQLGLQGQQLGLQGQIANQNTQAQLAGQGASNALQAGLGNQQSNLQGQMANANNSLQGQQLTQQGQGQNANNWLQAMLANQGAVNGAQGQNIANSMGAQQFNAGQMNNMNLNQGQMNQMYQQLVSQVGAQNAGNYLQMLLGMSTTGVGPAQIVQNPGWGQAIGGIVGTGIGALAGGVGAGIGNKIGSNIGGRLG